jgi:hypothetical protein
MKSILLLSLLPALAAAAVRAGNGPGATPAQIALFGAANQHPNATGSVYLIGANMTEDPSTTLAFTEWTASVNVTEVPGCSLAPSGQVITNSVISFNSMARLGIRANGIPACISSRMLPVMRQ